MQKFFYRVDFFFPRKEDDYDLRLPSIEMILKILSKADRLTGEAVGLKLDSYPALKEMGRESFSYQVKLVLNWPQQLILGRWPDGGILKKWNFKTRDFLLNTAGKKGGAGEVARAWQGLAEELDLTRALLYTPPLENQIKPLLEDLIQSVSALGGVDAVKWQ